MRSHFGSSRPVASFGGHPGLLSVRSRSVGWTSLRVGEGLSPSPTPSFLSGPCKPHIPRNLTAAPPPTRWPASRGRGMQYHCGTGGSSCIYYLHLDSTIRSSSEDPSQMGEEKPKGGRQPRNLMAKAPKVRGGNNVECRLAEKLRGLGHGSDLQSVLGWTFLPPHEMGEGCYKHMIAVGKSPVWEDHATCANSWTMTLPETHCARDPWGEARRTTRAKESAGCFPSTSGSRPNMGSAPLRTAGT